MKKTATLVTCALAGVARGQDCSEPFNPVTAADAFAALNPGWNLGNTLDAVPTEGSWNNPPVVASTFDDIKKAGFKSVRIPVTWADHFVSNSSYDVDPTWMDRVETVVDQVLARDFYAVLNVHHDSWKWFDFSSAASNPNLTMIEEKFSALWHQIGDRFKCKSSKLIFEAINEPPGDTAEHGAELNKINNIFLQAINDAGGHNPQRVVSLSGLGQDMAKTSQWFKRGDLFPDQPWGLQVHYYSPYDFIFGAWGKTIWGSDADKATLQNDFQMLHDNFTDVPVFVGEWDASVPHTETAARWRYFDYFMQTVKSFGYSAIVWDNGQDLFNRTSHKFYDPSTADILFNAAAGKANTLANSTVDASASSQSSSAYIFHKAGADVVDQTATYVLNGNTLKSITSSKGKALNKSQYSFADGKLTLKAAYLRSFFGKSATPGIKETLTLHFSAGASLTLQLVVYDTPTFETTSYPVQTTDLRIPVTYAGLNVVAAVKGVYADGTYIADDWTKWLGPLQQARLTYGSQWNYETNDFVVLAAGGTAIKKAGKEAILTVEFFPRGVGENAVNITITQS